MSRYKIRYKISRVRLVTRNGNDFSARFPNVAAAVNVLPIRSCLIDGEAIVTDNRGLAVFEMIRSGRHQAATVLCAFDLVELDGDDLRRAPIELRKAKFGGSCPKVIPVSRSIRTTSLTVRSSSKTLARSAAKGSCPSASARHIAPAVRLIG